MMKPTKIYDFVVPANGPYRLTVAGDYFKILAATGPVHVKADWGSLSSLIAGQGLEESPFQYLYFDNTLGVANTLRVVIGDEKFIDGMSGSIDIGVAKAPRSGVYAHTAPAVTLASTQMLAANANRQYLMVQNQHPAGSVWVRADGVAAAAAAPAFRIGPGGFWEPGTVPTGIITMIGDQAHALLAVVEG